MWLPFTLMFLATLEHSCTLLPYWLWWFTSWSPSLNTSSNQKERRRRRSRGRRGKKAGRGRRWRRKWGRDQHQGSTVHCSGLWTAYNPALLLISISIAFLSGMIICMRYCLIGISAKQFQSSPYSWQERVRWEKTRASSSDKQPNLYDPSDSAWELGSR